jgi:hypothetical protein
MITKETIYEINILRKLKIPTELVDNEYDYVYDRTLLFGYISQMTKKAKKTKGNPNSFLHSIILENSKYINFHSKNRESVEYIDQVLRVAKFLCQNLE